MTLQEQFLTVRTQEQFTNFIENHRTLWQLVEETWFWFQFQHNQQISLIKNTKTPQDTMVNKDDAMGNFIRATQSTPIQPMISLPMLMNGKQYELYEVSLTHFQGGEIKQVLFEPDVGLAWNKEKNAIIGTPHTEGNLLISFIFQDINGQEFKLSREIYINGDPKTKWKKLSSEGQTFRKEDQSHDQIQTPEGWLIAGRMRGRSHAQIGTCCDDDFVIGYHSKSAVHFVAVSDGAGSAKFSRYGSKLAVNSVKNKLFSLLDSTPNLVELLKTGKQDKIEYREKIIRDVFYRMIDDALKQHQSAATEYQEQHGMDLKSLSCTLLFAFVVQLDDGQWLTANYWVGDGAIASIQPEFQQASLLGMVDSGDYSGETLFLSHSELNTESIEIRTKIRIDNHPPILILMTDGVSDPKFGPEVNLDKTEYWQNLWKQELQPLLTQENPAQALETWLDFWSQGEHDDRTLAMFVPTQYIPSCIPSVQIESEQCKEISDLASENESTIKNISIDIEHIDNTEKNLSENDCDLSPELNCPVVLKNMTNTEMVEVVTTIDKPGLIIPISEEANTENTQLESNDSLDSTKNILNQEQYHG